MLWTERLASITGADRISSSLSGHERYGPYILFITALIIDGPVLGTAAWLRNGGIHPILDNPVWALYPVAILFVVWAGRRLATEYRGTAETIAASDPDFRIDGLEPPAPRWLKLVLAAAVLMLHASFLLTPAFESWIGFVGPDLVAARLLVIYPLYYIAMIDLAALFLGIHVVLPARVRKQGLTIDYHDPLTFDEVEAIGTLIKRSSQLYFLGLILYTVILSYRFLSSGPGPAYLNAVPVQDMIYLGAGWLFGIFLFLFPVYWLHKHMKREKDRVREEILQKLDESSGPHAPLEQPAIDAQDLDEFIEQSKEFHRYTSLYFKLDRIDAAPTYPVDYRIVRRIVILAILPFLINIVASLARSTVGT